MTRRSRSVTPENRSGGGPSAGAWVALIVVALGAVAVWQFVVRPRSGEPSVEPAPAVRLDVPPAAPPSPQSAFVAARFPTDQDILRDPTIPGVFQPTAAGNPMSALFGSVRTTQVGGHLIPSFHEGIDIAPLQRDARGHPLDNVCAVAEGRVGYINRAAGDSNYGNYVVLLHSDPLGEVYTLYAHLAEIAPGLRAGLPTPKGTVLGRMGNTANPAIPLARAHVHFEVGVVASARFDRWFRAQRLTPDHGNYNGWNLLGVDPRGVFKAQHVSTNFEFQAYLTTVPAAFEVVLAASGSLDYFRRYPRLWQGAPFTGGCLVLACSEDGVPLSGRCATPDEARLAGSRRVAVLKVNEVALGRNGAHLVTKEGNAWRPGHSGERLLEILTY